MRLKLILLFNLFGGWAIAQSWSVPAKSGAMQMGAIVYLESIYQQSGALKSADTLSGTGLLIADSNKFYIVTAKHVIQQLLLGENQQLANNNLFVSTTWKSNDSGMKLLGLSNWSINERPFVFSSDEEDLAIISLQKSEYRPILAAILKSDQKPVSINYIDKSNDHYSGEPFFHPSFFVFKTEKE